MGNKTCRTIVRHTEIPRSKQKWEWKEVGHGRVEKKKKWGVRGEDVRSSERTTWRGQCDSLSACPPHAVPVVTLCPGTPPRIMAAP